MTAASDQAMIGSDQAGIEQVVGLLRATDLRPGPVVDPLFRRLVKAATAVRHRPGDVDAALMSTVHALCARGETLLEEHWADRVAADPFCIEAFPYRDNYRRLARGEYLALREALGRAPRRLAFAGSGPLPLTAVELHQVDPDLEITCVDRDPTALDRGARTVQALCRDPSRLQFRQADVSGLDYGRYDAVVVAALVGLTGTDKHDLLRSVVRTVRPDAVLAARSVPPDGRQWLYPRIDPLGLPAEVEPVQEWRPPAGVINSLLILRRAPYGW